MHDAGLCGAAEDDYGMSAEQSHSFPAHCVCGTSSPTIHPSSSFAFVVAARPSTLLACVACAAHRRPISFTPSLPTREMLHGLH